MGRQSWGYGKGMQEGERIAEHRIDEAARRAFRRGMIYGAALGSVIGTLLTHFVWGA